MIDPRELRIGNWFQWSQFSSMGKGLDRIMHGQMINDYADFKEPVALTPEWLERFGFEQKKDSMSGAPEYKLWVDEECDHFMEAIKSMIGNYGVLTICNGEYSARNIHYVHELQNLYFALTGTELSLKNKP